MEARAIARQARVSPMKARRVVNLIRGLGVEEAQNVLTFAPQGASEPVLKVLNSAVANAANNQQMDTRDLVVVEAFVHDDMGHRQEESEVRSRADGNPFTFGGFIGAARIHDNQFHAAFYRFDESACRPCSGDIRPERTTKGKEVLAILYVRNR